MGEQSLGEPISTDSSTHSPPTQCWLPAGGKEGARHFQLGLLLPRWTAAVSLARLGTTWDKSCNVPGTERRWGAWGHLCALPP